jgi:tetratricopeptide (TPR) repeat protein
MKKIILLFSFLIGSFHSIAQTNLTKPEASQRCAIEQRIGLTDIKITYHSPLTQGRTIWGELVPYDQVWRAGANENTTISFSTNVKVEGKNLAAGTYGLHMIPTATEWTIIFSKNNYSWGSFFYKEKEDALRVKVKPTSGNLQDWLSYSFNHPQPNSVVAVLKWEKIEVPIKIEVDVHEIVYGNMHKELDGVAGFFWQGHNQAATYCIENNIHLDQASVWIDKSITIQKTFTNLSTKANLLDKQGKASEAAIFRKEALTLADENQLNTYGYLLMGQKKMNEALDIFKLNVKKYPESWNVYDSLAEALENSGNKKEAIKNYKIALTIAPENQQERIRNTIKKLGGS